VPTEGSIREIDVGVVPRVAAGLNLKETKLTSEEGFLLSRVDGSTTLEQLVKVSGLSYRKALETFVELKKRGVITWDGGAPVDDDDEMEEVTDPWIGMSFDPFELGEEVDLSEEVKKKILYYHTTMHDQTHYEMLQVDRRAEPKEIKRAYFKVSREFHPDSFFRKNLGSYKQKIEAIFKRISQAYEVLGNEQKRAAYEKTLPYEPTPEEIEEQRQVALQQERAKSLRKERRQRLLKHSPVVARKGQARKHYEDAKSWAEQNEYTKAANSIRLALTLDPQNEDFKKLLEEVAPRADEIRAENDFRRGRMEESMGRIEEAITAYLRSIEANPNDARALHRVAALLLEMHRDLRQALTFSRKANQLEQDNPEYLLVLAKLYTELNMKKNAIREYTRYLVLNPLDERSEEVLNELRKSVE
jgi:tetratricopeptide (TPR) repeat protein